MQTSQDRARIKQMRIMKYFIDAASEIIRKEGLGSVTIRKAAELAGYTSATLYNYFDNLPHLVFLATMNYLEEYNKALPEYVSGCDNSIERYMAVCKCFSEYSYANPDIYELLFFTHSDEKLEEYTRQYYDLYPEKIVDDWPVPLNKIYQLNSIYSRSFTMLQDCVEDGYITKENAEDFNDVNLRVFKSILSDVKEGELNKDEATAMTVKYYFQVMRCYLESGTQDLLDAAIEKLG